MSDIQENFSRLSIADESLSLEDTTPETPQTGGNSLPSSKADPQGRDLFGSVDSLATMRLAIISK